MKIPSPPTDNTADSSASRFFPTVVLHKWWLIKPIEGVFHKKKLGVSGIATRGRLGNLHQAVRAFSSAPILKIHDAFTLETVDGVTILLKGLINKVHTKDSGFPDEVFQHFVFGFPPYWEGYVVKFLEGGSGDVDVARTPAALEKLPTDYGGLADFREGTPNKKRKAINNSLNTKSDDMDLSQASEGSRRAKRTQKSYSRLSDTKQCHDSSPECTPNNEQKFFKKSRFANYDKNSTQADKGIKNTERVLGNCCELYDVKQKGDFHTQSIKDKSNARGEANNPKKKARRKLSYERNLAAEGGINGKLTAAPEFPSLKKSRSGRKLLKPLEFWRNQTAVYDMERQLTCIKFLSPNGNLSRG